MRPSLQDASQVDGSNRGIVVAVPVGAAGLIVPQSLRLEDGTWSILVARLVPAAPGVPFGDIAGPSIARGPAATEPDWPVWIIIRHGRGAATWTEVILCAARGTTLVRSDDFMQIQMILGIPSGGSWLAADSVLMCAAQLIAPMMPAHVSETVVVGAGGKADFTSVPPCCQTLQIIGANVVGAVVTFTDAAGVAIGRSPAIAVAVSLHVPTTAVRWDITGLTPGDRVTATYEVLQ